MPRDAKNLGNVPGRHMYHSQHSPPNVRVVQEPNFQAQKNWSQIKIDPFQASTILCVLGNLSISNSGFQLTLLLSFVISDLLNLHC